MRKILIIGATSSIASATARLFAADGDALFLVARNNHKLKAVADDLSVHGAGQVQTALMDALDYDRHQAVINEAITQLEGLDVALIAYGTLPNQRACEASFELARREFETNALSVVSLLAHLANVFEPQGRGSIAFISSVAGDRGRQSNYVYGAAKAAVNTYLQGLRNRLARTGVHVLTIKPGFVDTPMTSAFAKGVLWATAEGVATDILQAIVDRRDVLYTPWFWRYIMALIRVMPERLFKHTSL
jgi:decaprenylphospho-beta-D-erythro-pentofuranosid-2-ulose 2-reductase